MSALGAPDGAPAPVLAPARTPPWLLPVWLATAFLASMCGIGGGLFAVPILHYLGGLPLRRAVGTSLVFVVVLAVTSTLTELLHTRSALQPLVVAALVVGGFGGAQVGFLVARRMRTLLLKKVFVVVLLLAGLRVLGLGGASPEAVAGLELGAPAYALVLLIGFGGGFLAPLLGVGGGLLVVPALFLSLRSIGYLEARACSLAMAIFVAGRSLQLYWRAGDVERAFALRLGPLTALGALAGVLTVHQEGWAEVARSAMGLILVFVSGRFAWDVLRARSQA